MDRNKEVLIKGLKKCVKNKKLKEAAYVYGSDLSDKGLLFWEDFGL